MTININQHPTGVEIKFFKLGKYLEIQGWINK